MKAYKLLPTCKDFIWGGDKLKKDWGKQSVSDRIAESWELSCHPSGASYVIGEDITLAELLKKNPKFVGTKGEKFPMFPMLIKLIDSKSNLSIQVHPSDSYALAKEGQFGKTEMWYIVSAEQGAGVYCGFSKQVDSTELEDRLKDGTICEILNFVEVKAGDSLFIKSGTVHAICGGLVICEVQQNSSLTYRLYDYGRLDDKGQPRDLHIAKSLEVTEMSIKVDANQGVENIVKGYKRLAKCEYFTVNEITENNFKGVANEESFHALTFLSEGILSMDGQNMLCSKGDTVFVAADAGQYSIKGKNLLVIQSTL